MSKRNAVAVHREHGADLARPGEYSFYVRDGVEGTAGMVFFCPCGCQRHSLEFDNCPDTGRPRWHWDGNRTKPTISPSIHNSKTCGWHGFLRNGVFEEC
jgi:hypothetical protein